jgi:hypothetical protein
MIPTVEEIIAGMESGTYSREQSIAWLKTHAESAGDEHYADDLRDSFAAAALTGILAKSFGDMTWQDLPISACNSTAKVAYAVADAMLRERVRNK